MQHEEGCSSKIGKPPGQCDCWISELNIKPLPRNGSQTFYDLLNKAAEVHNSKSHDYASNTDPFANYRFAGEMSKLFSDPTDSGLIGRFGEKLFRLSNLDSKNSEPLNESIEDTETDLLVIIGLFAANRIDRRKKNVNP